MRKMLGQVAPTSTSNVVLYSCPLGLQALIETLIIANVTGSAATYSVFYTPAGGSPGVSNALFYAKSLAANSSDVYENINIPFDAPEGKIEVAIGTGNAITITAMGQEVYAPTALGEGEKFE